MAVDFVIRNARVVDGTGAPWRRADVAVDGERIDAVGRLGPVENAGVIEADGLCLAPGFIDIHNHGDYQVTTTGRHVSAVMAGVTTVIVGNCGLGCFPAPDERTVSRFAFGYDPTTFKVDPEQFRTAQAYFEAVKATRPMVNIGVLTAHNPLRTSVVGFSDRESTDEESDRMADLLRDSYENGAVGMSTGLTYSPGNSAGFREILVLADVTERHGRFYSTHARNRDYHAELAILESIRLAEDTGVPVHISHMVPTRWAAPGAAERIVEMVVRARERGLDVTCDMVAYSFGVAHLLVFLPRWADELGFPSLRKALRDPIARERLKQVANPPIKAICHGDFTELYLRTSRAHPEWVGKSFYQLGRMLNKGPHDVLLDVIADEGESATAAMWSAHCFEDDDVHLTVTQPFCSLMSDGVVHDMTGEDDEIEAHPFTIGWTARILGDWVRQRRWLTLEEAVHKMTGLPAARLGLRDRGTIAPGQRADLVLFNPDTIADRTSLESACRPPTGIETVFVNGQKVFADGRVLSEGGGELLTVSG